MPTNASEWVGFVYAAIGGVLVLGMILTFALAFLDSFFGVSNR